MAKAEKEASSEGAGQVIAAEPVPATPITFRDKDYSERILLLRDWRELRVKRARVTVQADDAVAIAYLRKRPDFEQLQE
ncbi:hypothetical protein [Pseudomonas plecoglossicida]|uniref:hypothetical protein n=1 Tax=Pseudomonas plecoglossicida TaxID=70775 RepID=UPI00053514FE|nr:hypothetical protein [Pseudomonas plecoglossicida]GLR38334.1 hypothetical protein GCM10011247_37320 [Pseudomonas plecoglossicida]